MKEPGEYLVFADRAEWRVWLETHHAGETEAWVVHGKRGATEGCLAYKEGVEEALCFGWIDGRLRSLDAERFVLRYSPRRRGSTWAASNKARAERLIREGRMTQAGLDSIAEAKRSGEGEAATAREDIDAIPPDLQDAFAGAPDARTRFVGLTASRKKQLIWWVSSAKKAETRERRVQAVVAMVADGEPRGLS
jgi:uncharacterized protein YdeI (YjbR/CyaY-like superfamily)